MIRDTLTTFATAVASGDSGTRQLGDVIDLEGLGPTTNVGTNVGGQRDAGGGQNVRVIASVNEAFTGTGTTPIITLEVVTSDNANLTSPTVLLTSPATSFTDAIAGYVIMNAVLPTEGALYKRYLGMLEVIGTGTVVSTTGKIDAALALDDHNPKSYVQGDVAF